MDHTFASFAPSDDRVAVPGAVPRRDALEGYLEFAMKVVHEAPGDVNTAFFGADNVETLQRRIQTDVRRLTGRTIGRQCDQTLVIIMTGVYQTANDSWKTTGLSKPAQLEKLNNAVMRVCVRQCVDGIVGRSSYLRDTAKLAAPMDRPVNPSIKGHRILPGMLPPM